MNHRRTAPAVLTASLAAAGALLAAPASAAGPYSVAYTGGDGVAPAFGPDGRTRGIHVMPISSYDPSRYLGWAAA